MNKHTHCFIRKEATGPYCITQGAVFNALKYAIMGKNTRKKTRVCVCVCVCMSESLCCTPEINTTL